MIRKVWRKWEAFWFYPVDLFNIALMRMLLSLVWLAMYGIRHTDFGILYSESGILPSEKVSILLPEILQSAFPFYFQSESLLYASHWLYLALLLGLALGLFGRSLTWLVFILHVGFLQRNPGLTYGADLFSTFWLFGLCFVQHNKHFSVWNLRSKSISQKILLPEINSDWISTVGYRLIQVQLCLVYAFTGIEKLKGSSWWDGTAIWQVVNMKDLLPGDFTFLYHVPLLVAVLTIGTIVFEIYFVAAVTNKFLRPIWLTAGVVFHLMIGLFIDIPFFALVMILPYLLFIGSKPLRFSVHQFQEKFSGLKSAISG